MLNPKQYNVVFEFPGNTIVSASPGTGKTKTLVARAQHKLDSLPRHRHLALITYTNAAADEISSRLVLHDENVFVGTIHRFCLEFILRPFSWIYKWPKPKIVNYDELKQFILLHPELDLGESPLDEINKIKRLINGELDFNVEWANTLPLQEFANIYYSYLNDKGLIDFNEILYRSFKILSEQNFVLTSLANKFYEICVDEFQDTNIFQYELLKLIYNKGKTTFFLVGDEKQRIYRFAGAIENAFAKAAQDFGATIVELDITYRSSLNIVNTYSRLFSNHPTLRNESKHRNSVEEVKYNFVDQNNNNTIIRSHIQRFLEKNNNLSEIAILTTSWRHAFNISRNLRQNYRIVGLGALPHRQVNNSTFALLKSVCRFIYSHSIKNLRIVKRNMELHLLENDIIISEDQFNYQVNSLISKIQKVVSPISLAEGLTELTEIFNSHFFISHGAFEEIFSLLNPEEAVKWTINDYFEVLAGVSGITVNTIHQAKGLEYELVILSEVNQGRIPYQRYDPESRTWGVLQSENIADGRTLLYVGLSRAKEFLVITHGLRPSLFINEIKS